MSDMLLIEVTVLELLPRGHCVRTVIDRGRCVGHCVRTVIDRGHCVGHVLELLLIEVTVLGLL